MPDNEPITAGGTETAFISKAWENKDMKMLLHQAGSLAGMSLFVAGMDGEVLMGVAEREGVGEIGEQGVGTEQLRAGIPHNPRVLLQPCLRLPGRVGMAELVGSFRLEKLYKIIQPHPSVPHSPIF